MITTEIAGLDALVGELDRAVDRRSQQEEVASRVKEVLVETSRAGSLRLPEGLRRPEAESYARRLLHLCPEGRYSVLAMVWGPRQGTALHDHAGMWCVEGVLEGEIDVVQFDLVEEDGGRCRFQPQTPVHARPGSAGALIPPFEYHTLVNPSPHAAAITLHVYGGEMTRCTTFEPVAGGWHERREKRLEYS